MPPDDQSPSSTADAAAGVAVATPPKSASESTPFNHRAEWSISKAFEGSAIPVGVDDADADVSNGSNGDSAPPTKAEAQDTKPAQEAPTSEGVTGSDAPESGEGADSPDKSLSRREQARLDDAQKIAELDAEVKRLSSAEYREQVRAEVLADQQRQASETVDEDFLGNQERFERLKAARYDYLPMEDREWLDLREERRETYSPVERHFRSIYERKLAEATSTTTTQAKAQSDTAIAEGWDRIKADMGSQIEASSKLPGVDKAAFKQSGVTWQTMAEQIHAAGAAWKEAELAERVEKAEAEAATLRQQLKDGSAEGLGSRRAPPVAGRSAGASTNGKAFDPDTHWRGNLAAAFGWDANGTG